MYAANAATFLIQTLFGFYMVIVLLRFLLQWVRADFYNPVSQFLVKATNPVLRPMRRYIPGYGGVDFASIVLLLALQFIELTLMLWVLGQSPGVGGLLVWSAGEVLGLFIKVYLVAIFAVVILSWINPRAYHPAVTLLRRLTEPLLAPARRLLPAMGGIDFSPILVLVGLQLTSMLLIDPIRDLGRGLALG